MKWQENISKVKCLLLQALTVGSDLLSSGPGGELVQVETLSHSFKLDWHWIDILQFDEQTKRNIQKTFKKFYKKLDVISNEVEEVKNIAEKTQSLVSDILYKEGIEKIDAAFKTLMDGANNLNQTLG